MLKSICSDLNLGLHSFRAGGANAAANSNVNERYWKRQGRWKRDTAKKINESDLLDYRLQVAEILGL